MKKILFPTDCSRAAENALHYALPLAREFNAKIDVLHVYQVPLGLDGDLPPEVNLDRIEAGHKLAQSEMDSFIRSCDRDYLGKIRVVNSTAVAREIVKVAEEEKYELIIMGMKGKHALLEKIMGSVTTHTMKHAPCPVLAIPASASYQPLARIAYATDLGPSDQHAVEQLMAFAGVLGAQLHFVHVETTPDIGDMEDRVEIDNYPFDYVDFTILNQPTVWKGLDTYTKQKGIDLLALFAPQRGLWDRLFHVSVTKHMAFNSELPLLVFHN